MKFEVTQAHIDNGKPCCSEYHDGVGCVLALAIYDALKKRHKPRRRIQVGLVSGITINGQHFEHSKATADLVRAFDGCPRYTDRKAELVKPGIYEITPVEAA